MEHIERRAFMKGAAIGALAFTVGGVEVLLTPSVARAQGVPLRTLTAAQAATLDALGETLVPGALQAGISHFVDQQISIPAEEALLEARILNVRPPYANFYRAALGAVDRASQALNGRGFAQLGEAEQRGFVDNMRQNKIEGWQGPAGPCQPSSLFWRMLSTKPRCSVSPSCAKPRPLSASLARSTAPSAAR